MREPPLNYVISADVTYVFHLSALPMFAARVWKATDATTSWPKYNQTGCKWVKTFIIHNKC